MPSPFKTYRSRSEAIDFAKQRLGPRARLGVNFDVTNHGVKSWSYSFAETCGRYFANDDAAFKLAVATADSVKKDVRVRYMDGTVDTIEPFSADDDDIDVFSPIAKPAPRINYADYVVPPMRKVTFSPLAVRNGGRGRKPSTKRARVISQIAERAATVGVSSLDCKREFGMAKKSGFASIFTGRRGICKRLGLSYHSERTSIDGNPIIMYYIGEAADRIIAEQGRQMAFAF